MSSLKMFVSYSHGDEAHKDEFLKYVKTLKQNGLITEWHDRMLQAGDIFDTEIRNNLLNSDIVVFLVSQNFLSSTYCMKVELENALKRVENATLKIIPIILSHCAFQDSPFGTFLARPKDAKPICEYTHTSQAWMDVYDAIKQVAEELIKENNKPCLAQSNHLDACASFTEAHKQYLNELGFAVQHPRKDKIHLDDIFVFPEMRKIDYDLDNYDVYVSSDKIINTGKLYKQKTLIIGPEQGGKTSISKLICKRMIIDGYNPVLIKGESLTNTNGISEVIQSCANEQYVSFVDDKSKTFIVVDDLYESPVNEKFKRQLVKKLESTYPNILIVADSKIKLHDQLFQEFDEYKKYEIVEFGHLKRSELVEKWNGIGVDETCCIIEQQKINDSTINHIDSILMKNIVPRNPVYILMILQLLESNQVNNLSFTSYGHCYHSLIVEAFKKAKVRFDQLNDYFNYLSELAFYIYNSGNGKISDEQLRIFQHDYSSKYYVSDHDEMMRKLQDSRVIQKYAGFCKFQYKYIYYFFVAKKISELEDRILDFIDELCNKIHSEKHANILIFVTHHTKDKNIIERITYNLSGIYSGRKPARLDNDDVNFLNDFASKIESLVIDNNKDIEVERDIKLRKIDESERELECYLEEQDEEDISSIDELEKDIIDVNRSAKAVEILGQIIRNRKGSLTKPQLELLSMEAVNIGFRFLDFYFTTIKSMEREIINEIQNIISKNKGWSNERISKEARFYFWAFSYYMSFSVIRKLSCSIGHKDLMPLYETVSNTIGSEISKLVEISIELEFTKVMPKSKISTLWDSVKDNLLPRRLLQEILINHLHLHYVSHEDKNWIATKLSIPIKEQLFMQKKKQLKQLPVR